MPVEYKMPVLTPIRIPTKEGLSFFGKIRIWLTQARRFKLAENWYYPYSDGKFFMLPKGFIFDGASIPRLLWFLLNPYGILMIPGLLHDYAYEHDKLLLRSIKEGCPGDIEIYKPCGGKVFWDELFLKTAIAVNGFETINKLAYYSLVLFGGPSWRKHREKEMRG